MHYFGIDASESLIAIGRDTLPKFGLPAERLTVQRIEDTDGTCEHVVCLNVLSNIDNYHRPLERMLLMARRASSCGNAQGRRRVSLREGHFLDAGVDLRVHVNHYDIGEVTEFIREYGFDVDRVVDRRTGGSWIRHSVMITIGLFSSRPARA